jgi:hypothetical protein
VGVHQVVPALGSGCLRAHDPLGERTQLAGKVFLGQSLERPGDDVADVDPGRQLRLDRQAAIGHPGEDLDLDASACEPLGDLDNVDVQAARIACSWLLQR